MKNHKKEIPSKNNTPFGWWIISYIERFEYYDENKKNLNRRCLAWENTIIIKAKSREEAYKKAMAIGNIKSSGSWDKEGRKGKWIFEGLTSLLPIYEELEDGSEILWREYNNTSVKKIKSLLKSKNILEAFID